MPGRECGSGMNGNGPKNRRPALRRAFEGRQLLANARMAIEPCPQAQSNQGLDIRQAGKPDFDTLVSY